MSDESKPSSPKPARPQRRDWPLLAAILFAALVAGVRLIDFSELPGGPIVRMLSDRAVVNLCTLGGSLLAIGFAAYWFFAHSGAPKRLKLGAIVAALSAVVVLAACFRIEAVRGDLRPVFRFRWSKAPDRELAPLAVESKNVDLSKTSPSDFPEFLGPERSLHVHGRNLAPDWSAQAPKQKWLRRIGAGWSAFSAVNGYAVTQEQRGDRELVTCCDVATGDILWINEIEARHETTMGYVGPRATPTIDRGDVYTLGATGVLQRIDGATGKTIWRKDLVEESGSTPAQEAQSINWGRAASPLVHEGLVIVPLGGPKGGEKTSLAAFEAASGALKWKSGSRQASYASPKFATIDGVETILSVNEDSVSGHDPKTGKLHWEHPWPGDSAGDANCSQPWLIGVRSVLTTKGYGQGSQLIRIRAKKNRPQEFETEVVWANHRALRTKFTNVALASDFAYGLSDGILQCVDAGSGEIQWRASKRFGNGQVLAVDNLLLIQSEEGEISLAQLFAEKYIPLGSFQALPEGSGACWNNLCLHGNLLLVRNSQYAACWELPLAP